MLSRLPRSGIRYVALLCCLVAALALAACGDDSSDGGGSTSASTTPASDAPSDATLIVATPGDVGTDLDPRTAANTLGRSLMIELYDGLVEKNYYDADAPFAIVPGLAESWEVSEDRLTYTFTLREGVRFIDGTPVDAAAVEFSLRTILDPDFEYYYERGAAAASPSTGQIAGVRATGPMEVQIRTKGPFAGLLDSLSNPAATWIISPAAIRRYGNEGIAQNPVGTGPFKAVRYTSGQSLEMVRNDDYWRGPARIQTLVYRPIPDAIARASALQTGEVQVAEDVPIRSAAEWEGRDDIRVEITPRSRMYACFLNYRSTNAPMIRDPAFREALSLATDREAMSQIGYEGEADAARGFYVEGTPTFDEGREPLPTDIERAREIIDENGWAGTRLRFIVAPGLGDPAVWDTWVENLRTVGIDARLETVEIVTWVGDFSRGLEPGGAEGMCATAGSDNFWTYANYASREGWARGGSGYNPGYYTNPEAERYFLAAKEAATEEEYVDNLREADGAVARDHGIIFMVNDLNVEGVSNAFEWAAPAAQQHAYYTATPTGE